MESVVLYHWKNLLKFKLERCRKAPLFLRKIIEILIGEWLEWKGLSKKMNKLIKCVKIRKACLEWNKLGRKVNK